MLDASVVSVDPATNLQLGLAIELSVLPPYLYALWSIKPAAEGASPAAVEAANSIRAVIYEEMLHAALVGNLLRALGATPDVTGRLMSYPGSLPGHITTGKYAYEVGLGPLSTSSVATFKLIERPDWVPLEALADGWITIGDFYDEVRKQLRARPPGAFRGGHQLPEGDNPGPGQMIQVVDLETALEAIATIVDQGEGHRPKQKDDPKAILDDDHEVAHYYQFDAIATYLSSGLIHVERDLHPVIEDPDAATYTPEQRAANATFNQTYTALLDSLQVMWDADQPRAFGRPTELMGDLAHLAAVLRGLGPDKDGKVAGPTFEYLVKGAGGTA